MLMIRDIRKVMPPESNYFGIISDIEKRTRGNEVQEVQLRGDCKNPERRVRS